MPDDELTSDIREGRGRFDQQAWFIDAGRSADRVSTHERYHRMLNDLTTFGLTLDCVALLARSTRPGGRFDRMLRRLVGRCRVTHEAFATYLSTWSGPFGSAADDRRTLSDNAEYQGYFDWAAAFVDLLPTRALGALAFGAVARVAMNGPLPDRVVDGDFDALTLADFRASDAPDHRLARFREILDAAFWSGAYAEARTYFRSHPHWDAFLDNRSDAFNVEWFFRMTQVGDRAMMTKGGVDPRLETDVGNFLLDQACFRLAPHGLQIYSLAERRRIEVSARSRLQGTLKRFYDAPEAFEPFDQGRAAGRERIQFREKPLPARVRHLPDMPDDDWAAYNRIVESEGAVTVYLRAVADVMRNHGIADRGSLGADDVVCFLRKKRQQPDGSLSVDLHVLDDPQSLVRLFYMLGGNIRLCVSGALLTAQDTQRTAAWIAESRGMFISILLDADSQAIVNTVERRWAVLAWHIETLHEVEGQQVLFLFPLSEEPQMVAFFRPCTSASGDAALRRLNPSAFPLRVKLTGARIEGLPPAIVAMEWTIPLDLAWTAKRFLSEEYAFVPLTPEEEQHG